MNKAAGARPVKLVPIGNSRGIRLPKDLLQKFGWGDSLILKEMGEGIFLYSEDKNKLSWKETYRAMAAEEEDWSDLDAVIADGLD